MPVNKTKLRRKQQRRAERRQQVEAAPLHPDFFYRKTHGRDISDTSPQPWTTRSKPAKPKNLFRCPKPVGRAAGLAGPSLRGSGLLCRHHHRRHDPKRQGQIYARCRTFVPASLLNADKQFLPRAVGVEQTVALDLWHWDKSACRCRHSAFPNNGGAVKSAGDRNNC
jgi:hypothetical protein